MGLLSTPESCRARTNMAVGPRLTDAAAAAAAGQCDTPRRLLVAAVRSGDGGQTVACGARLLMSRVVIAWRRVTAVERAGRASPSARAVHARQLLFDRAVDLRAGGPGLPVGASRQEPGGGFEQLASAAAGQTPPAVARALPPSPTPGVRTALVTRSTTASTESCGNYLSPEEAVAHTIAWALATLASAQRNCPDYLEPHGKLCRSKIYRYNNKSQNIIIMALQVHDITQADQYSSPVFQDCSGNG